MAHMKGFTRPEAEHHALCGRYLRNSFGPISRVWYRMKISPKLLLRLPLLLQGLSGRLDSLQRKTSADPCSNTRSFFRSSTENTIEKTFTWHRNVEFLFSHSHENTSYLHFFIYKRNRSAADDPRVSSGMKVTPVQRRLATRACFNQGMEKYPVVRLERALWKQ